jgi:seryl-tRNA synthetase
MAQVAAIKGELDTSAARLEQIQADMQTLLLAVPNLPHESVPVGADEHGNVVLRTWSPDGLAPRALDFPVKRPCGPAGLRDGVKLSGSRFTVMKGRLRACTARWRSSCWTCRRTEHGYTECYTPYIVNPERCAAPASCPSSRKTCSVPGGQDGEASSLYLIPTAEVPLTNLVRDEILAERCAAAQAHRPHALLPLRGRQRRARHARHDPPAPVRQGRDGADRAPRQSSWEALEQLTGHAEAVLQKLELPYRVCAVHRRHGLWRQPRPTTSKSGCRRRTPTARSARCSNCEAFQARRMQARFKNAQGKNELVHTLNGSGLAVGRTLVAVLENYQNADGSRTHPQPDANRAQHAVRGAVADCGAGGCAVV